MGSHSLPVESDPANPDWHAIEDVLDELAEVARSAQSDGAFYRLLLDRVVAAAGVSGGAVWTAGHAGELQLDYQIGLVDSPGAPQEKLLAQHQDAVEEVLRGDQPRFVPLHADNASTAGAGGGNECWALLDRFRIGPLASGVIELVQRRALTATQRGGYLRLLAAMVELADDFHRNRELGNLRQREQARGALDRFALRAHRSLDAGETAYLIANEGRHVIGCDRLSVLLRSGRTYFVAAMSGVDVLERRSKLVRTLERLVAPCMAGGDPLWYCDGSADMPDQIEGPLHAYLDESHARVLAIVPLREAESDIDRQPGRIVGALVAEQLQTTPRDAELREGLAIVAKHSAVALANAVEHSHMPLARVGRLLARVRWLAEARQLPKTVPVLVAICAVVAGLTFIPADFNIASKGELQPAIRRDVFASDDGVVSRLLVDHGEPVRAEQPLVMLRQPQLDLELRRVGGEIQTARKKLAAVQAERLTNPRNGAKSGRDTHQLTADEEELKELLNGLDQQRAVLEQQRDDLVIRSPIDGETLTWNLRELLEARPVERGQALLTVADLKGPWIVELCVPDHRTGHVLAAREALKPDLDVSFALASEPGTEYAGRVSEVALSSDVDETTGPNVLVTVEFDRSQVAGLRPGATVLAKVDCGRRAVGYVWLHELFEFIQTHWWW
jgi:multidrug efflux pump subunit AcrA (membrane-fusion protein)